MRGNTRAYLGLGIDKPLHEHLVQLSDVRLAGGLHSANDVGKRAHARRALIGGAVLLLQNGHVT